jgi:hypothetical protein
MPSRRRQVSEAEALSFAQREELDYCEVSAKTGQNIDYLFYHAAQLLTGHIEDERTCPELSEVNNRLTSSRFQLAKTNVYSQA